MSTYRQEQDRKTMIAVLGSMLAVSVVVNLGLAGLSITQETRRDAVVTCVENASVAARAGDAEASERWVEEARRADRRLACKDGQ